MKEYVGKDIQLLIINSICIHILMKLTEKCNKLFRTFQKRKAIVTIYLQIVLVLPVPRPLRALY